MKRCVVCGKTEEELKKEGVGLSVYIEGKGYYCDKCFLEALNRGEFEPTPKLKAELKFSCPRCEK